MRGTSEPKERVGVSKIVRESSKIVRERSKIVRESGKIVRESSKIVRESSKIVRESSKLVRESIRGQQRCSTRVVLDEELALMCTSAEFFEWLWNMVYVGCYGVGIVQLSS
jgi:hypothetical protein